ncbi:MAG: PAS domain S-box protein [Thermodesulfobacteriota bacterium]|nr:PAS domain S-box protein [Thermodesulfobacteriota bacterium]
MENGISLFSVYLVDFVGSSLMIIFSLASTRYTWGLKKLEPKRMRWSYLFWLCMALTIFALSRSIGHVLKYFFVLLDHQDLWKKITPYSGGLNTITFIIVGILTFYYAYMHEIIDLFRNEARDLANTNVRLKEAHMAVRQLNLSLEQKVDAQISSIREEEQKYRDLFQHSKDFIFFCDKEGRINDTNPSFIEFLNERKEDILDKSLATFFSEENEWNTFQNDLFTRGFLKDFKVEFRTGDETLHGLLITATSVKDDQGTIRGFNGIGMELTATTSAVVNEEPPCETKISLSAFAAQIADELDNPLEMIAGYTRLLEKDLQNREDGDMLKSIRKQVNHCLQVEEELRETALHFLEMTPLDVNSCLEEVMGLMEPVLSLDRILVLRNLSPDLPLISANKKRLSKIFFNLINSSRQSMDHGGFLGIWTRYHPDQEEIEVIIGDNGPQVPPEFMEVLFDPLPTTKKSRGGLGLHASLGMIRAHDGRMTVNSPTEDSELIAADLNVAFHIFIPEIKKKMLN